MCSVCGFRFKSDQIKRRWDGQMVCYKDYENRNILDFMRVQPEVGAVPYAVPEQQPDQFISVTYLSSARAGDAIAGYAVSGIVYQGL